jgi:hypothetical protein
VNRVTTDFQAIRKAADEYGRATQGNRTIRREMLTRDRNDPSCYFNLVFFDSYESAMKNSTPWPLGHLFILAWPVITVMCLAVSAGVRERRAMLDRMTQSRDRRGPGSGRSVSPSHECIFRRCRTHPAPPGTRPAALGPGLGGPPSAISVQTAQVWAKAAARQGSPSTTTSGITTAGAPKQGQRRHLAVPRRPPNQM